MTTYSEFRPTCFDRHIVLDDREDWLVLPVGQNRDSGPREQSNFDAALKILGGEGEQVEVHRFGHWACGWFEIIICDPSMSSMFDDIVSALEDYPVLDDEDLSRREHEAAIESWGNWAYRDFRKEAEGLLDDSIDFDSATLPADPQQRWCKNWGLDIEVCSCGDCILTELQWIEDLKQRLDDMSTDDLYEMGREHFELEYETHNDGPYFKWKLNIQKLCDVLDAM